MARSGNQKQKILYLVQILSAYRDDTHVIPMKEIVEQLEARGIQAERKSIYDDMEVLRSFGLPITYSRKRPGGYYISGELPEGLALLMQTPGTETEAGEAVAQTEPAVEAVPQECWQEDGEERTVKLHCPVELYGRVSAYLQGPLERKNKKDGTITVTGQAVIGPSFYGWLTAMGEEVQLLKPAKVIEAYREYLKTLVKRYKK